MSSTNGNGYKTLLATPLITQDDQLAPETTELWSSGLCDCCADPKLCCITCWFPCVTFGRIAKAVDNGKTSWVASAGIHGLLTYMTGFGWIYSCMYRSKMRERYMLESTSSFRDCLAHFCCERCALCQEYRELQFRGCIMSPADDKQQTYGVEAVPIAHGGMTR
uniref:protein PLANT CADMIUM RESISTANCE 2-like n=1 Tax=Erigeron canadensis TaxID=72917 RepID=UPI001CB9C263|nr:protein PLANT CADMIUM RESISTANCE 2-like [Erigeron canadensis]